MLKRIVAVLFALAGLAERLTGLPRPVRAFVLLILRPAEAVARRFRLRDTGLLTRRIPFPPRFTAATVLPMRCGLRKASGVLAVLLDSLAERNSGRGKRCIAPAATMIDPPAGR